MSPAAWTFAGLVVTSLGGIIAAVAGLLAAARSGRAKDRAGEAATAAALARDYAEPTGNGYAEATTGALTRIEDHLDRIDAALLQHLADHAHGEINRRRDR